MTIYKNIIFYNGIFYTDTTNIKISYTHSRLRDDIYLYKPSDINTIHLTETPTQFNTGIILLDHFHWNAAHNMWEHLYSSWYELFKYLNNISINEDFQYIINKEMNNTYGIQHINLINTFSGNKTLTLYEFKNKYNKPLLIPWLIVGMEEIGIGHIFKEHLLVKRGDDINDIDSIETFVNRVYLKYNIKRNSLIDNLNINECNNIIFIKNKRPYNGIENLFNKMNNEYKGKYNFIIIDYSKHDFKEQLCILNQSCLCIVGIGTARANTPFMPNGAIEIQTFQPNISNQNFIEYCDYHIGTLSKFIKVYNIPYYIKEECTNNSFSNLLKDYIDKALKNIPCNVPVNLEENIPIEIRNLKYNNNYDIKFNIWRNTLSNIIEDLIKIL